MDAVKFLNSRRRTCDSYPGCNGCELKGKPCPGYVTYNPISATQYERVKPNENVVKKERAEKEMDAVKFVKERRRMYTLGCIKKGINDYNTKAEDVVAEVEEWAAAHPLKTRQSVFLEQYPEAQIAANGVLDVCPAPIFHSHRRDGGGCINFHKKCVDCRREFWMQEVE